MVLIKTIDDFLGPKKVPHPIVKKLGFGKYVIKHPEGCECMLLHSVKHAPWVTYNQMSGVISCDHCKTSVDMPCPSLKQDAKHVIMDLKALEDDLYKFQIKHENCPEVKS